MNMKERFLKFMRNNENEFQVLLKMIHKKRSSEAISREHSVAFRPVDKRLQSDQNDSSKPA